MDVFISYRRSADARDLASNLAKVLGERGVSASFDEQPLKGRESWSSTTIERAVRDADNILLLIDTGGEPSEFQESEWRTALEAVWTNPRKRLIPLLIGNAELPTFVRSSVRPGQSVHTFRMKDRRSDWNRVVDGLTSVFKKKANLFDVAQNVNTTEEDKVQQKKRLDYLKSAAQTFKP